MVEETEVEETEEEETEVEEDEEEDEEEEDTPCSSTADDMDELAPAVPIVLELAADWK